MQGLFPLLSDSLEDGDSVSALVADCGGFGAGGSVALTVKVCEELSAGCQPALVCVPIGPTLAA